MHQSILNFRFISVWLLALTLVLSACEDERQKGGRDGGAASGAQSGAPLGLDTPLPPPPAYNWRQIEQRINDANGEFLYVLPDPSAESGVQILFGGRGFKVASPYVNGFATVKDSLGKGGVLDRRGAFAVPMIYDKIGTVSSRGLVEVGRVDSTGRMVEGILDTTGRAVVPLQYDVADLVRGSNLFKVGEGPKGKRKFGLVNAQGQMVLPMEYSEIQAFSEGVAVVKKGGLYGYVDVLGNLAVEPKYVVAFAFRYGASWAKEKDSYVLLDNNFNVVGNQYYQAFATLEYIEPPQNVHNDDYGTVTPQVKGQTFVTADSGIGCAQGGKWGVINTKGEIRQPFKFNSLGIANGTWVGK